MQMACLGSCFRLSLKSLKQGASSLCVPCSSLLLASDLAQVAAELGLQLGFSWAPLNPAQVAAICRLLWCTFPESPDQAQLVTNLGLHLWEAPETSHRVESFRPHQITTQPQLHKLHTKEMGFMGWAPAELILYGSHSQSLQLIGLMVSQSQWGTNNNEGPASTGGNIQLTM